jgi:hypothetical protein
VRIRTLVTALAAALATEGVLLAIFLLTSSGNAGGIWVPNTFQMAYLGIHDPVKLLVERLNCDDLQHLLGYSFIIGSIQLFLLYWLAVAVWGWMQRRRKLPPRNTRA